MKKFVSTVVAMSVVVGGYLAYSALTSKSPVAEALAAAKTYSATMYVAGMGGHFAKADVTIDPNNTENPIKVDKLDMVDIGGATHPTHDARIDAKDKNTMYWSTYKLDTWKDKDAKGGNLHVGKTDLKTGNVVKDTAFPAPERAKWTGANYCASGQSEKYFMPVSMADEGYIDVFDKATMELKHRVFFDDLGAGDVRGHEVRRELDAVEAEIERAREGADHERLRETRHADEEAVAAREHRGDAAALGDAVADHRVLAEHLALGVDDHQRGLGQPIEQDQPARMIDSGVPEPAVEHLLDLSAFQQFVRKPVQPFPELYFSAIHINQQGSQFLGLKDRIAIKAFFRIIHCGSGGIYARIGHLKLSLSI